MNIRSVVLLSGFTVLASASSIPAFAATVDNVFVFGDSTVDTGWFRYKPLPSNPTLNSLAAASLADGGRIPDTPYGVGAAQVLAAQFGLTATPRTRPEAALIMQPVARRIMPILLIQMRPQPSVRYRPI